MKYIVEFVRYFRGLRLLNIGYLKVFLALHFQHLQMLLFDFAKVFD